MNKELYKRISEPRTATTRMRRHPYEPFETEPEFILKEIPNIIVSTSSLLQIASTCKNLTCIDLSYTSLLHDSRILETGEYVSTLQHYAIQPGLTQIQIPIKEAIQTLGNECQQLQLVRIQRCEWVTAHVIWMFVYYCSNLTKLDARRSTKCSVKRLISNVLEFPSISSSTTASSSTTEDMIEDEAEVVDDDDVEEEDDDDVDVLEEDQDPHTTIHFVINGKTSLYMILYSNTKTIH